MIWQSAILKTLTRYTDGNGRPSGSVGRPLESRLAWDVTVTSVLEGLEEVCQTELGVAKQ